MIYTIKNNNTIVDINSTGAEIKRIYHDNRDYMHDSNPVYWGKSAPLLWPHVGVMKDGYSIFDGVKYPLKRHGIIREAEFSLAEKTDSKVVFKLLSDDETLKLYPFDFELLVTYEVIDNLVKSTIVVKNLSKKDMPFSLGLHPAFKLPLTDGYKPEDYRIIFEHADTYDLPTIDVDQGTIDFNNRWRHYEQVKEINFNYSDFDGDALVFENFNQKYVMLTDKDHTHGVKFDTQDFPMLGIWSPIKKNAPFVCLEPWMGCGDEPNTNHEFLSKRDIKILKPNEESIFNYSFELF